MILASEKTIKLFVFFFKQEKHFRFFEIQNLHKILRFAKFYASSDYG